MSFRGNLKTLSLADIFQTLTLNSQSGVLSVQRGKPAAAERHLLFERGEIRDVARAAADGARPFLEYLVGRGLLADEQAALAARKMADSGAAALATVAELGYAPSEALARAARSFAEEEIYDLFTWDSGDFEFTDGPPSAGLFPGEAPAAGVRLNTGSMVMEAARRIDEWGRIRQALPSGREVFLADEAAAGSAAGLDAAARRVLGLADASRDIDDLIADSHLSRFEVGGLLKSFLEAGLVRGAPPDRLTSAAQALEHAGHFARAAKLYERLLALSQDSPQLRLALAECAAKAGDRERAVIHFGVLADRAVEEGRLDQAAEHWTRMAALVPASARAHQGLAEYYRGKGKAEASQVHYAALVKAHLSAGAADRALAAAQAALEPDPENPAARALVAETLLKTGRRKEAIEAFESLAEAQAGAGEFKAAADTYRRALQIDPAREETRRKLTQLLNAEEHRRRAHRRNLIVAVVAGILALAAAGLAANEFLVVKPRHDQAMERARARAVEAEALATARRYDEAIQAFQEAAAVCESAENAWSLTGLAGQARARRANLQARVGAVAAERAAMIAETDRNSTAIRGEAEALLKEGRLEDARARYQALERYGSPAAQAAAREALGKIQASLEEIAAAAAKSGAYASDDAEFEVVLGLFRKYPAHPTVRALSFPVRVESDPPGATVRLNDGPPAATPAALRLSIAGPNQLVFERRGYRQEKRTPTIEELAAGRKLSMALARVPAWTARVGAPVEAPIAVAGTRIVVGDRAGTVWCLAAADGKELWKRPLGPLGNVTGAAAIEGDVAYLGSFDGRLYALNLADGKDRWAPFKSEGLIRFAPRVARVRLRGEQAHVFFGSDDGRVYCLDARTGEPAWKSEKLGAVCAPVLVAGETVYAASDDEHIHALGAGDGKELWKLKLGAAARTAPLAAGGLLCAGADDGFLYALDPARREVRWRQLARGAVRGGPVLHAGRLYFATMEGDFCAAEVGEAKADVIRQWALGAAVTAAPLVTETRAYVGGHDGVFHAVDLAGGREAWSFRAGAAVRSAAAFADGLVIVGCDDGCVYAFDER